MFDQPQYNKQLKAFELEFVMPVFSGLPDT